MKLRLAKPTGAEHEAEAMGWVAEVGDAMRDPGAPLAAAKTVSADAVVDGQSAAVISGYTWSRPKASTRP